MNWYLKVLRDNYANFEGRARRTEFWMFNLFQILIIVSLYIMMFVFIESEMAMVPLVVLVIYALGTAIPSIAVTVRRLHDTGKSGWWYFITFVPYVGSLILLIFTIMDGEKGPNQYGPDPKRPNFEIDEIGKIENQ